MLGKIFRRLDQIEEYLLSFMVLQMGCSIFLQVVMRYAFHSAITWLDELVHIEVIVLAFFGAGAGIRYGSHISVDVVKAYIREPFKSVLELVSHGVMAVYAALVVYFGSNLILLMSNRPHFTPTLRIPKHYLYAIVCIGVGLICIRSLFMGGRLIRSLLSGKPSGGRS